MITIDANNQFVTTEGKSLGVFAHVKTTKGVKRYQFRDESGRLYSSGMSPAEFCKRFWFRDDYQEPNR